MARLTGGVGVLLLGGACAVLVDAVARADHPFALGKPRDRRRRSRRAAAVRGRGRLSASERRLARGKVAGRSLGRPCVRGTGRRAARSRGRRRQVRQLRQRGAVPAGGGTFDGSNVHADARRAVPLNRWSHLALTYDGATLRLYVNGSQTSSRATTGTPKRTTDPLWIGGNQPYGEYFQGLIDQVRVYDRALSPREVRAVMTTPIGSALPSQAAGLVGAYALDRGSGRGSRHLGQGQRRRDHRSDMGIRGSVR